MRIQDVVDFLKLPSAQTVDSWIKKGVGPQYYWAGHQIRYQRREVLKRFVEHTGPGRPHAGTDLGAPLAVLAQVLSLLTPERSAPEAEIWTIELP